eukprot:jgi/Mesvir1/18208/Mv09487-RA.1
MPWMPATNNGCPSGWTSAGKMGCLKVSDGATTTPLTECGSAQAVMITSHEENELVYAVCTASGATKCWIGLNDVDTEGVFYWASAAQTNGYPHSDYTSGRDRGHFQALFSTYSSWVSGQPRTVDGQDDGNPTAVDNVYIGPMYYAAPYTTPRRWVNMKPEWESYPVVCQMAAACTSDADCASTTPFCNTNSGICFECNNTDIGREMTDLDNGCNATQPFCDTEDDGDNDDVYGSCSECLLDRHCNSDQKCNKGVCETLDANGCPEGYLYHGDIGCYRQLPDFGYNNPSSSDCSLTWPGSVPVTISSPSAQAAVLAECTDANENCWIGANDIAHTAGSNGNDFHWWETPTYNGPTVGTIGYNNFFEYRPHNDDNNQYDEKNCVYMSAQNGVAGDSGAWIDSKCAHNNLPLICQMDPVERQDMNLTCPDSILVRIIGNETTIQLGSFYVNGSTGDDDYMLKCTAPSGDSVYDNDQLRMTLPLGENQPVYCTLYDDQALFDVCEFDVTVAPVCTLSSFDTDLDVADCAAVNSFVIEHSAVFASFGCLANVNPDNLTFAIESFLGAATGCVSVAVSESGRRRRSLLQLSQAEFDVVIRIYSGTPQERDTILALLQGTSFLDLLEAVFEQLTGFETLADLVQIISYIVASARSDPHFVTQAGVPFDFMGEAGRTYCVLSSRDLAVNVRMMGPGGALVPVAADASGKSNDTRTWMDQLAVVYKGHRVLISAQSPAGTPYTVSHGSITFDEERLDPFANSLTHSSPDGLVVSRVKNRVRVLIPQLATLEVEVVRAAWWETGKGPGANFLNFQVKEFHGPQAVHGVLGQTLATVKKDGVALEGQAEDYETASIFATNWRFSKYNQL